MKLLRKLNSGHGALVVLPLSVVTVFCFGLVILQPVKMLQKSRPDTANQKPSLGSGKARPQLTSPYLLSQPPDSMTLAPPLDSAPTAASMSSTASLQLSAGSATQKLQAADQHTPDNEALKNALNALKQAAKP